MVEQRAEMHAGDRTTTLLSVGVLNSILNHTHVLVPDVGISGEWQR